MKNALIIKLVEYLLKSIKPEMLRTVVDKLIDMIEDKIAESETSLDDVMILPIIRMIRETFDIPDND